MTAPSPAPTDALPHAGGRPFKYEKVDELNRAITAYFDLCDPHTQRRVVDCGINERGETIWKEREIMTEQQPYTVSGLALAIGVTRQTLLNYKERGSGFFDSIQQAVQRCEAYAEAQLYGPGANGAKFNLVNNYSGEYKPWADKQVFAGDLDAPLSNPLIGITTEQLRKLAEEQPHGADAPNPA